MSFAHPVRAEAERQRIRLRLGHVHLTRLWWQEYVLLCWINREINQMSLNFGGTIDKLLDIQNGYNEKEKGS